MAKYVASNITYDVPEEGEVFTRPGQDFIYKRVGENVYHIKASQAPNINIASLPVRSLSNLADIAGVMGAGQFANYKSDPSFFAQTPITYGQNLSAMEQVRRAQGLGANAPIPGFTPQANIIAQPGIAPASTLSVVAQGIADVQRRIDEIKNKPLSTASIIGAPSVPYVPPATTSAPSVSGIVAGALGGVSGTSGIQMTSEQQDAQNMSDRIQKLNLELAGRATDILTERKTQGVSDTQTTIDDLTSQLLALDAQAKAIPEQMQQWSQGRLVSEAGVAPLQTAVLRNNAIQALLISAQLAGAQNKLGLANRKVEEAVNLKYAQKEADRDALIANLQLAQKSPAYTIAEKKQAADLEAAQNQIETAEATIKKAEEATEKAKVKYTGKVTNDTWLKIQKATTEAEVENIVQMSGDLTGQLKEEIVGGFRVLRDTTGKVISTREVGDGDGVTTTGTFINEFGETIQATPPPKAPISGEQNSFVFFQRMKDALDVINAYPQITLDESKLKQALLNQNYAIFKTSEQQIIAQAIRQFTEARLRKDSGAAIPEMEFANDRRTYFPQVGENAPVLQRKARARENTLGALRQASGNAYWNFYGENPRDVGQKILRGGGSKLDSPADNDVFNSALLGVPSLQSTPATQQIGGFFSQLWNSILGR